MEKNYSWTPLRWHAFLLLIQTHPKHPISTVIPLWEKKRNYPKFQMNWKKWNRKNWEYLTMLKKKINKHVCQKAKKHYPQSTSVSNLLGLTITWSIHKLCTCKLCAINLNTNPRCVQQKEKETKINICSVVLT